MEKTTVIYALVCRNHDDINEGHYGYFNKYPTIEYLEKHLKSLSKDPTDLQSIETVSERIIKGKDKFFFIEALVVNNIDYKLGT
jgi:hypothetical protein